MASIITLTTDFGSTDAYVAAMKGVILSINPGAKIIDISHAVLSQNVAQAAFILSTAYPFFPAKTIHVVVVDPGVGTGRQAIILRTPSADFVAPDNGVLSYVLQQFSGQSERDKVNPTTKELQSELEAVAITEPRFWRLPVSTTFHGRDIFAPVAAWLSLGSPLRDFGKVISSVKVLSLPQSYWTLDGLLVGRILHIDSFGNLITNIKNSDLPPANQLVVIEVANQSITGLSRTYADSEGLLALINSSGYLEVSLRGGSACAFLDVEVGSKVKVRQIRGGNNAKDYR